MSRRMVVTVGTSLFTSASWRSEGPFALIPGYPDWSVEHYESPRARREAGGDTAHDLQEQLGHGWPGDIDYFVWPPDTALRYSAEVATLLRWQQHENETDLARFLADEYERIELVCSSDQSDPSRIAAGHLDAVMTQRWGLGCVELQEVLTSESIRDKARHFGNYLRRLGTDRQPTDLVVSGGYKLFAMYASLFAAATPWQRENWRVIYLHEESHTELIVQKGNEEGFVVEVDGEETASFEDAKGLILD